MSKQERASVYETPSGILFVPSPHMWAVHTTAAKLKLWARRGAAINSLRKELEQAGTAASTGLFYAERFRQFEWFIPWLMQGKGLPDGVYAPTPNMIEWARRAWDHVAICAAANITVEVYCQWFARRLIPDRRWLRWLYGGAPPKGVFVVGGSLQKLRHECGLLAVLDAAHVSRKSWQDWNKKSDAKTALTTVLDIARNRGRLEGCEALTELQGLSAGQRRAMIRLGQAAVMTTCSRRAGLDATVYAKEMADAARVGAKDHLQNYLAMTERGRGKTPAGLLADNFFLPTPSMLLFRKEARSIGALGTQKRFDDIPGFDEWFLDWTLPRNDKRKARVELPAGTASPEAPRAQRRDEQHASNGTAQPKAGAVSEKPGDYITAKQAAAMTAMSYSTLSRLCREGGPVRYQRDIGQRLKVHAADLAEYIAKRDRRT